MFGNGRSYLLMSGPGLWRSCTLLIVKCRTDPRIEIQPVVVSLIALIRCATQLEVHTLCRLGQRKRC